MLVIVLVGVGFLPSCSSELTFDQVRAKAEKGDAVHQNLLGKSLLTGVDCNKDPVEAVKWLRKAADQGHAGAQYELGSCYLLGEGVEQDNEEAIQWFRKAAKQGNAGAEHMLQSLEK